MKIKKGTILLVKHSRKGEFFGKALKDFDTEVDEFYPIAVAQEKKIEGLNTEWENGEEIPCRNSLCSIEKTTLK